MTEVEMLRQELEEMREAVVSEGMEYREDDGPRPYWRNRRALDAESELREARKQVKELELKVRTLRMLRAKEDE